MPEQKHLLSNSGTSAGLEHYPSQTHIDQKLFWLLGELASELSTTTNLEIIQRILACKLRWMLDFTQCTLAVHTKPSHSEYTLFNITNPSIARSTAPQKIPLNEGWPGKVITESKPYFLTDLTLLPPSIALPMNASLGIAAQARSLMLLSLRVGERTIGSLNFSSNQPRTYCTSWRSLASLLAAQVAGQLGSVLAHEQTSLALKTLTRSQVQLKSAYEFRRQIMESVNHAIYTLDLEGNFTLVNQKTAEITGYSVEVLLGFPILKLFSLDQATAMQNHFLETIDHGVSINQYDAELISKDGSRKIVVLSLAPLLLEGTISAVVGTIQETTERN